MCDLFSTMINKEEAIQPAKETKEDRFIRVAEKRVLRILNDLNLLSKCSNKRLYSWNDQQIADIWKALDSELKHCKLSFQNKKITKFKLRK